MDDLSGWDVLIVCILIGLIPAWIARSKGYFFFYWWVFGSLLFILALPMAILMKSNQVKLDNVEGAGAQGRGKLFSSTKSLAWLSGGVVVVILALWAALNGDKLSNFADMNSSIALEVSAAKQNINNNSFPIYVSVLTVLNKSDEKITIESVQVNNRDGDCVKEPKSVLSTGSSYSETFVGCGEIVKASVKTNRGVLVYNW